MLKKIMHLSEEALDELHDSYDYIEKAALCKEKNPEAAKMYYEMSKDEMKHAGYLHKMAESHIAHLQSAEDSEVKEALDDVFNKYYEKCVKVKVAMQTFEEMR